MWSPSAELPADMDYLYNCPNTLVGKDLYYIGGMTGSYNQTAITAWDMMLPMTDILVFHIDDSTWELKKAGGADVPAPRLAHTTTFSMFSMCRETWGEKV